MPSYLESSRPTLVHLVGINGAGKSTLAHRLAERCRAGGMRVGLDSEQNAFDPAWDRSIAGRNDTAVHRMIVDRALACLAAWSHADVDLMIVDRWYESYDARLPRPLEESLDDAIREGSGFRARRVLLTIGDPMDVAPLAAIRARLEHTKAHRSEAWWALGDGSLDERARQECAAQTFYQQWAARSKIPYLDINTTTMRWAEAEARLWGHLWAQDGVPNLAQQKPEPDVSTSFSPDSRSSAIAGARRPRS